MGALVGCGDDEATGNRPAGATTWTIVEHGSQIELLSATPFKTESGQRVPACGPADQPEGFFVSLNLKGQSPAGPMAGNKDLQMREGDWIDDQQITVGPGKAINPSIFALSLGCVEAYPDQTAECDSEVRVSDPSASIVDVVFERRSESREHPVAVAILVDHSESMIGFGNQDRKEVRQGFPDPGKRSDPTHARYRAASEGLIRVLNPSDRLIAWYFNEDGVKLACNAPNLELAGDAVQQERACFGTRHEWVGGTVDVKDPTKGVTGAFTDLGQGAILAKGRSPLWAAVDHAWDFLMANATSSDGALPRQIVVISDSPDTCDPKSPSFLPDEPCPTHLDYETFRSKVEALPMAQRIPISFVQFQSYGYPHQDGAQMEVACLTGGVYKWINRLDYADVSSDFERDLQRALQAIRYTFGGVWRVYVDVPSLSEVDAGGNPLLPPGRVYAVDGAIALVSPSILAWQPSTFGFHRSPPGDERLRLRRACTSEAQCPGGADGDCFITCDPQGSVCAWPATNALGQDMPGIPIAQGGACTLEDQTAGTCCCGTCQADEAVCSVMSKPCCDSSVSVTCLD
ncbi:MAG: hypothetical protein AMXMBFR64_56700 [Myxococcales bacterium]